MQEKKGKRFLIVTGEKSGDIHGAELMQALKKQDSTMQADAVGGEFLYSAGANILIDSKKMGVVGIAEILGNFSFFYGIYKKLTRAIDSGEYDAVILIDYPTLNLRLAKRAKKRGLKVFYYISPQLWAWREGRVETVKKYVDVMFVILPFEEEYYRKHGVSACYIGHPFLDTVQLHKTEDEFLKTYAIAPHKRLIGITPGSRMNEVNALSSLLFGTAEKLYNKYPDLHFLIPCASTIDIKELEKQLSTYHFPSTILQKDRYEAMAYSRLLLMKSGSSTLEAGILGTPMVIVYRLNPLTYFIAKRLVKIKMAGLVNIVLGKMVAPELLQHDATVENLLREAEKFLNDTAYYNGVKEELSKVKSLLQEPEGTAKAARIIAEYMTGQK